MRSAMTSWSTPWSVCPPSMRMVLVPAPSMTAPIPLRKAHRSTISGSRAAFSITVTPSAAVAAMSRFSVAPTLG